MTPERVAPPRPTTSRDLGPGRRALALLLGLLASVGCAVIAGACLLTALRTFTALRPLTAVSPDEALVLLAAALAGVVCLYLSLLFAIGTWSLLPGLVGAMGRRLAERLAPAVCARVTSSLLGVALLTTTPPTALASAAVTSATAPLALGEGVAPATAGAAGIIAAERTAVGAPTGRRFDDEPAPDATGEIEDLLRQAPEPGWRPRRPAAPPSRGHSSRLLAASPRPGWSTGADDEVAVVRRGDSLWSIAARHLGADATAAQIACEWPRWYAANRHLIGDDPGLILPGQVLVAPGDADAGEDAERGNPAHAERGNPAHAGHRLGAQQ